MNKSLFTQKIYSRMKKDLHVKDKALKVLNDNIGKH